MTTNVDVIVLGTGSAAQNVAYTCRASGWSVAVVDSRPFGPNECIGREFHGLSACLPAEPIKEKEGNQCSIHHST